MEEHAVACYDYQSLAKRVARGEKYRSCRRNQFGTIDPGCLLGT
jgi:hypothetical protein